MMGARGRFRGSGHVHLVVVSGCRLEFTVAGGAGVDAGVNSDPNAIFLARSCLNRLLFMNSGLNSEGWKVFRLE